MKNLVNSRDIYENEKDRNSALWCEGQDKQKEKESIIKVLI